MARPQASPPEFLRGPDDAKTVYLLDASTGYEAKLLDAWLRRTVPGATSIRIKSSKRGRGGDAGAIQRIIESDRDVFLVPVRVMWLAPKNREGRRTVSLTEFVKPGDPRDPRGLRARWIRMARPKRVRYIAAPGALVSGMADALEGAGIVDPLPAYITRRAWLALDKAERRLRGNRYKIPRFVPEAILSRRDFLAAVNAAGEGKGLSGTATLKKAERYLREIAATHSPYVIDLIAGAIRKLISQGYGAVRYDPAQVARIADLGHENPIVFLPSHRSNLDRLSLQFMLWENDLPPNHTAGGINLNFFPIGPLLRRTGVFFIRRSFRDNELYKAVLRGYLDYLVEKRFPLEWYMEGGRSRSGKLLPPRLGMLNYVVDSLRRGKAEDIYLLPVSIAYDQIQDVPDYAREAQGRDKEKESIGWLVRAIRSMRRRYGDIYIRFGEPVSTSDAITADATDDETAIELQKLAFEVMYRIGNATPVTPTALMSIALLSARGSARNARQLGSDCATAARFLEARGIALTEPDLPCRDEDVATSILEGLVANGYVSSHEAVGRRVFWLDEEQMVRISYYRNMVAHYFVPRALLEMALNSMPDRVDDPDLLANSLLDLRDLLKFEFFFQDKERFLSDVFADLSVDLPDWETTLLELGPAAVLDKIGDHVAYWAALPFLDAYQVVGDELEGLSGPFNERTFLKACLARARMYRIEEKAISGEAASQVLFRSALALAENRGLLDESPGVGHRRVAFAAEVRSARAHAAIGL